MTEEHLGPLDPNIEFAQKLLDTAAGDGPYAKLQAAWNSIETLPSILFTDDEARALVEAITGPN